MEAKDGGRPTMLIGLSRENCQRLLAGQPIMFDTSVAPPKGLGLTEPPIVFIVASETEAEIKAALTKWITDKTLIIDLTEGSSG